MRNFIWLFVVLVLIGCGRAPDPTPAIAVPDLVATVALLATFTPSPTPTETAVPTATLTPSPTATSVVSFAPTFTPVPTGTPAPTAVPLLAPGEVWGGRLEAGTAALHIFEAIKGQTLVLLARAGDDLDVAVAVYDSDLLATADSQSVSLTEALQSLPPARIAQDQPASVPEFMIYTPQSNGPQTVALGGVEGTAGDYKLYLFDTITVTANTPLVLPDSVSPGQTKRYPVASVGARPVAVLVRPNGTGDVALVLKDANGAIVISSDYGRGGSPEAAFVSPGTSVAYTAEVTTRSDAAVNYTIVVIAIRDNISMSNE